MTTSSDWFRWLPDQITAEEYASLPEEFSRTIEVSDGHVVKCESPSRVHNRVAFNLAMACKNGRKPEPCLMVETDVDVRITDVPLNFRRPDVSIYQCIADDARLYSRDGQYRLAQLHTRRLTLTTPVALDVGFPELTAI